MEPSMQPKLAFHPARRVPAWGVAAPAIIAVASALFTVIAERDDAVAIQAINPPTLDLPLQRAENARIDDAGGASRVPISRLVVAAFAQGPLTLHL
jgi:hypothetical protein